MIRCSPCSFNGPAPRAIAWNGLLLETDNWIGVAVVRSGNNRHLGQGELAIQRDVGRNIGQLRSFGIGHRDPLYRRGYIATLVGGSPSPFDPVKAGQRNLEVRECDRRGRGTGIGGRWWSGWHRHITGYGQACGKLGEHRRRGILHDQEKRESALIAAVIDSSPYEGDLAFETLLDAIRFLDTGGYGDRRATVAIVHSLERFVAELGFLAAFGV